ncbi:M28 family peptidase [uncultured Algibacter sp.]|uniref:M28 family metallopeptidase n=1 Tax=uncultured Algibacter sp. TaxID=298659 RepID=UPI00261A01A8|nr:M28 family peptidase [uncultured Algibacter sp.]
MNRIIYVVALLLVFSCGGQEKSKLITITPDDVKSTVAYLASDDLAGRDTGSEGIEKAAVYIETIFKKNKIKPYFETYRDNFKVDSLDAFNVVGFIEGSDAKLKNEFVVIGAHYDHIGYGKTVDGDSIANGANDNAAGTSAVIALAKYFSIKKNNKRSIIFSLFSAEEKGLLGSKHLAKRLKAENLNLYTMVNFEMIGVPFKDRDYEAFVTGFDMSNMAERINAYTKSNVIGKSEVAIKYSLFKRSDNYPFYQEFKVPCQTISSCDMSNFDYYHHVDDEVDKLDYQFMASLINKLIPAIETMTNTTTKEIMMNNE